MSYSLYWNTVTPLLRSALEQLMKAEPFNSFRLVGGTSLSLQIGHRISVDIDLFTDATYGSIDFDALDSYLRDSFLFVTQPDSLPVGMGRSCYIGNSKEDAIKLDLYYTTDPFFQPAFLAEGIRMATVEEIIAMKIDVIQRGGRKKDFWDLHEIMDKYTVAQMIALHEQRYPYSHDESAIRANFINFSEADDDFEPNCLRGKHWELIKLDMLQALA